MLRLTTLLLLKLQLVFCSKIVIQQKCLLLVKIFDYGDLWQDHLSSQSLKCLLSDRDGGITVNIEESKMPDWLLLKWKEGNIRSGSDYLHAQGSTVSDGTLHFNPDPIVNYFVEHKSYNERRHALRTVTRTMGVKRTIVIAVDTIDSKIEESNKDLSDTTFGTFGHPISLRSQMSECSHGLFDITPVNGKTTSGVLVKNGVYRLKVDITIRDKLNWKWENEIVNAAKEVLGNLKQFDHVLFCIPPDNPDSWTAWAYYWWNTSFFNGRVCSSPSFQMHEVGHNLGLKHSYHLKDPYGDVTGTMGSSSSSSFDRSKRCFNAPKSVQLGWYPDRVVFLTSLPYSWEGNLYGVADYKNTISRNKFFVRLNDVNGWGDIYISYNRAIGMTSETWKFANNVLIHSKFEQPGSRDYSYLEEILEPGTRYKIPRSTVLIHFIKEETRKNVQSARVRITGTHDPCAGLETTACRSKPYCQTKKVKQKQRCVFIINCLPLTKRQCQRTEHCKYRIRAGGRCGFKNCYSALYYKDCMKLQHCQWEKAKYSWENEPQQCAPHCARAQSKAMCQALSCTWEKSGCLNVEIL